MIDLNAAIVYDEETLPNVFSFLAIDLFGEREYYFEIGDQGRDDRNELWTWLNYWNGAQTPFVGFNNVGFDYNVLHEFWNNPDISAYELYLKAQQILTSGDRFGNIVWQDDRLAPQIDLYKIMHFDNRAKSTSLKALQFAMRSENVMEMPLSFDQPLTRQQIDTVLYPYQRHDTSETKKFAHISLDAIRFRLGLTETLRGDVLNWSDTKIGSKILEQRLGIVGRIPTTPRDRIALADIIFPYIQFREPEFNRVLNWMRTQTLSSDELSETIRTKGVFTGVHATVGGLDFHFGTGGIHGSVEAQRVVADDEWGIYDIDVAALYPSIAIVNRLYPEHLGEQFVEEYARLPAERSKHKKGTVENAALKLAANGTYGNSNNQYSPFYDPRFTMTITVNGQLMLCMLAEWLLTVPTLSLVQINTDGITYRCKRSEQPRAAELQAAWERFTCLKLESAEYARMWIRDVNNYIAEDTKGKLKQKGAFWFPVNFPDDISNASPPSWHKDFSAQVVIKAAVEHMVRGTDVEKFIYGHADPFDFMLRAKVDRSSKLMIGDREVQRITRYYMAHNGGPMRKVSPPVGPEGTWKRKNGISDLEYARVLAEVGSAWDERIHTKNKSKYVTREMSIQSGYLVAECNDARQFDFANLNYDWYVNEARKLAIG